MVVWCGWLVLFCVVWIMFIVYFDFVVVGFMVVFVCVFGVVGISCNVMVVVYYDYIFVLFDDGLCVCDVFVVL